MCGIIGYVGSRECRDLLLRGLQRLEYRGYDSAGLSLVTDGAIGSVHAVGNLQNLRDALARSNGHLTGSTGIGHTRWATHGRVTEANAHKQLPNGVWKFSHDLFYTARFGRQEPV